MNASTPAPVARTGLESIPALNGLRAVAVTMVFFSHSGLSNVVPGGLGVTVFFVLSGYLITTLMRLEHARAGHIDFRSFYLRRFVRLGPPLLVITLLALLLSETGLLPGRFSPLGMFAVLGYFGNYFGILHPDTGLPAGIGVIWSLAVEEHFYLFYPPLAALLLRLGDRRLSALVLGSLCVTILLWRCWLVSRGVGEHYIGEATDTRIDAILVGCVMAMLRNPWLDLAPAAPSHGRTLRDLALCALCLGALLGSLAWRNDTFRLTARYTVQSLAIAPLLWLAVARAGRRATRWLDSRPMVWLGTVSYALYLSHLIILEILFKAWPDAGWPVTTAVALVLTLIVCELMKRWVEDPCAALRKRLHRRALAPAPGVGSAGLAPANGGRP